MCFGIFRARQAHGDPTETVGPADDGHHRASSGIGLCTAFAGRGEDARVVLAARSEDTLDAVVAQITAAGGEAIAVPTDVGDRAQLQTLADAAIARFGRIDTWVNDAGVAIYGRSDEVSDADSRRLFDTNFWGVVNGSLVALPHLRESGGALLRAGGEGRVYGRRRTDLPAGRTASPSEKARGYAAASWKITPSVWRQPLRRRLTPWRRFTR